MFHDLALTSPLLILLFGALFTLVVDPFLPAQLGNRRFWGPFGAVVSALAIVACAALWKTGQHEMHTPTFAYHLSATHFSLFFVALVSLAGLMTHLSSPRYLEEHGMAYGEYYALVHFAVFGMAVLVSAESLLTLFIGLETMSLSIYVLVAFKRASPASVEGGMKYFILGSAASAVLLYGMALLYGLSGGTSYVEIQRAMMTPPAHAGLWLGLAAVMMLGAFLFKVAAVPFHMWAPDAYEGAPTPVTGLMSAGVKAAAFGALLKFLFAGMAGTALTGLHLPIAKVLAVSAVITMTVGNVLALSQRNVKRILAYSSVAHAGYLLLGCVAAQPDQVLGAGFQTIDAAVPFYLTGYAVASLAAFAALVAVAKNGEELTGEAQLAGMGKNHPMAAAVLALAMLSLAGVPPTLGFFGKLELIREVMRVDDGAYTPYLVVMVLNSVVAAFYYLRVTVWIYFRREGRVAREYIREPSLNWAMALAALVIVVAGALPFRPMHLASRAGRDVRTKVAQAHLKFAGRPAGPTAAGEAVGAGDAAKAGDAARAGE
jgi:NADH-quinone oxidoreductase subunit N